MGSDGLVFDEWVEASGAAAIDFPASATAKLTVPAMDVTVTATYKFAFIGIRPLRQATPSGGNGVLSLCDVRGRQVLRFRNGESESLPKNARAWGVYLDAGSYR